MVKGWLYYLVRTTTWSFLYGQLRSQLDLLKSSLESRVEHNQQHQKGHDKHAHERQFSVSDCVYVCNFSQGEVWLPDVIS